MPRVDIFALQTTSSMNSVGKEEMLGRSRWGVNIYCIRAGNCKDKTGYLQNAERCQRLLDSLIVDSVFGDFSTSIPLLFV